VIIVLTGSNSSALHQKLIQIKKEFAQKYSSAGIEQIDGEALEVKDLPSLLHGATIFAEQRLVVIKDISARKDVASELVLQLATIADSTDIVFLEPQLDKRTVFYKELKKLAEILIFDEMNEASAQRWVVEFCKKNGGILSAQDAVFLVRRTGPDQARLENEIQKLLLLEATITQEMIEQVVQEDPKDTIFQLLDYALSGQGQNALSLLWDFETNKQDAHKIFSMLVWQVNILAIAFSAKSLPEAVIAKQMKINPYVVSKSRGLARRLSRASLIRIIEIVATGDLQLKQTDVKAYHVLSVAVGTIAQEGI